MKTGRYRIQSKGNYFFAPQYECKFLCFTWWNYFDDICIDGMVAPLIYCNKKGADNYIKCIKEKELYNYV